MTQNRSLTQPSGFPQLPPGWISESEIFPSSSGAVQLSGLLLRKEPWCGARLLFVIHGMGEHVGRYLHLPHFIQNEVDAVYGVDLQGHGCSGGIRGHIDRFDSMTDDLALAVRRIDSRLREKFGKSEIHLLGHSLGGQLLLRLLFLNPELPVASATASAPFLGLKDVSTVKKMTAQALAKVWKSALIDTGLDVRKLSRDPAVCEHYQKDPLNHGKMTPGFFDQLLRVFEDTLVRQEGISVPLQFLIPLADRVVDSESSFRFFNALNHPDKRIKTYPGFYHEPFNEPGKEQVFEDLRSWIQVHSKS